MNVSLRYCTQMIGRSGTNFHSQSCAAGRLKFIRMYLDSHLNGFGGFENAPGFLRRKCSRLNKNIAECREPPAVNHLQITNNLFNKLGTPVPKLRRESMSAKISRYNLQWMDLLHCFQHPDFGIKVQHI